MDAAVCLFSLAGCALCHDLRPGWRRNAPTLAWNGTDYLRSRLFDSGDAALNGYSANIAMVGAAANVVAATRGTKCLAGLSIGEHQ